MAIDSGRYLSKPVRGADGILIGQVVAAAGHYLVVERIGGGDLALRTSEVTEADGEVVRLRLPASGYLARDTEPVEPVAVASGRSEPAQAPTEGLPFTRRAEFQDDGQMIGDDFDERRSHIPNLHADDELFI